MKEFLNFIALDIETTGFDFEKNEIIEIGAIRYEKGEIKDKFSVFIKPSAPVPKFIKQLTKITDEQLASGDKLTEALIKLQDFVGANLVVCHNTSFDIGFIKAKLVKCGLAKFTNQTLDTLELCRIYLPFIANHKLITVADHFRIDLKNAHRAYYDAIATGEILIKLLDFIAENIPLKINHRLLEIAAAFKKKSGLTSFLEMIVEQQKKFALLTKQEPKIDFHNRNYIEHKPDKVQPVSIDDVFGSTGLFSSEFANYEIRQGQIEMSEAILANYLNDEFLLVEAGTGVGKSLAYLIPSIIYSYQHDNQKIIISTNTKNLQEQLFYKDLPTISNCVNLPFKATLLKGRRNYICQRKWLEAAMDMDKLFVASELKALINLVVWKEFTQTGDISENSSFDTTRDASVWKKVSSDSFLCNGRRCPYFKQCYLMDVRQKAEESNLVIINHHLLLADMITDSTTLGDYKHLIVDEAHNLPQLAQVELGLALSFPDFSNFFNSLFAVKKKFQYGILIGLKTAAVKSDFPQKVVFLEKIDAAMALIEEHKEIFTEFFINIRNVVRDKGSYGKLRITNMDDHYFLNDYLSRLTLFWKDLSSIIMQIYEILANVNKQKFIEQAKHQEILERVRQKIAEVFNSLTQLYNPNLQENAFWMESFDTHDEKYPSGVLCYCPLDVSSILNVKLYDRMKSVVFTSATIAIRDKFKYFSGRMGLDLREKGFVQELVVQSPFDYHKQALVVVAGFLPDPKDRFFSGQSLELIRNSVEITKAGTMVLFTAYRNLNEVYDALSDEFYAKDIVLLAQGKGISRSVMLKEFREHRNSVLLGTNSFWEGVDVPGDSLELLILYKLPFMVPSEPIVEAYLEKLQTEGKDSFMHYMLPNALLKYRQGFGRLIRNKTDKGVVLVLDNRILTKQYGQFFKETIPAKTVIPMTDLEIYDYLAKWFRK